MFLLAHIPFAFCNPFFEHDRVFLFYHLFDKSVMILENLFGEYFQSIHGFLEFDERSRVAVCGIFRDYLLHVKSHGGFDLDSSVCVDLNCEFEANFDFV